MDYEKIEVDCHSGYKVNEHPVSFTYQGHRQDIRGILDRWYEELSRVPQSMAFQSILFVVPG